MEPAEVPTLEGKSGDKRGELYAGGAGAGLCSWNSAGAVGDVPFSASKNM